MAHLQFARAVGHFRWMKTDIPDPKFLSVPDAARLCGVTRNTVYTWVKNGRLSAYRTPGRTNLIRPLDLVRFMQENGMFVPARLLEQSQQDEQDSILLESDSERSMRPSSGATILVVDDDPGVRSLLVRTLRDEGQVYQASTGYEGLHLLTIYPAISLVILDLELPGQPGRKTLAEIQQMQPSRPIILLREANESSVDEIEDEPLVKAVLTKPLRSKSVYDAVLAVLGRNQ